jgi:hypothetical protein
MSRIEEIRNVERILTGKRFLKEIIWWAEKKVATNLRKYVLRIKFGKTLHDHFRKLFSDCVPVLPNHINSEQKH